MGIKSQTKKDKYHMISLTYESTKKDTNEFTYKTEQTQKTNLWLPKGINYKFGINRYYYT